MVFSDNEEGLVIPVCWNSSLNRIGPLLTEDDVAVALPMQACMQRHSLDSCQGDMYTVAINIRGMDGPLQP